MGDARAGAGNLQGLEKPEMIVFTPDPEAGRYRFTVAPALLGHAVLRCSAFTARPRDGTPAGYFITSRRSGRGALADDGGRANA